MGQQILGTHGHATVGTASASGRPTGGPNRRSRFTAPMCDHLPDSRTAPHSRRQVDHIR
jgi:hypothetical protein